MKSTLIWLICLLLIVCFSRVTISAQSVVKPIRKVSVKLDDTFFSVHVSRKGKLPLPTFERFIMEVQDTTCNFYIAISAIEQENGETFVILNVATQDTKKISSFKRQIKLEEGKEKQLRLKPRLKCLGYKYFLITAQYENEN